MHYASLGKTMKCRVSTKDEFNERSGDNSSVSAVNTTQVLHCSFTTKANHRKGLQSRDSYSVDNREKKHLQAHHKCLKVAVAHNKHTVNLQKYVHDLLSLCIIYMNVLRLSKAKLQNFLFFALVGE